MAYGIGNLTQIEEVLKDGILLQLNPHLSDKERYNEYALQLNEYESGRPVLLKQADVKLVIDTVRRVNEMYRVDTVTLFPGGIQLHNQKVFQIFDIDMISNMHTGLKREELTGTPRGTKKARGLPYEVEQQQREIAKAADVARAKVVKRKLEEPKIKEEEYYLVEDYGEL